MKRFLDFISLVFKSAGILLWIFFILFVARESIYSHSEQPTDAFAPGLEASPEPEPLPQKDWRDNIMPEPENKIYLTWAYRPRSLENKPPGINVLAPTWFYVTDNEDGIPRVMDITEMGIEADMKAYVEKAHGEGASVWATVVSFTPSLTDILIHTPQYTNDFIHRLKGYVETLGLDGINFDFENMNPLHKLDYTQFIQKCSDALKPMGVVISVDVTVKSDNPSVTNWYQCYDHESLGKVADYIAVMAYDQHGNHSGAGPVASLAWVERKLQGILEDIPSDKILLGIPFYGRTFPSSMPGDDPDFAVPAWSANDGGVVTTFKSHVDELLDSGRYTNINNKEIIVKEWLVKNQWDEENSVYYIKFIGQDNMLYEIWYEEEASLALKAQLVKKYHLAGAAIWQQAFGRDSFWETVEEALGMKEERDNTQTESQGIDTEETDTEEIRITVEATQQ